MQKNLASRLQSCSAPRPTKMLFILVGLLMLCGPTMSYAQEVLSWGSHADWRDGGVSTNNVLHGKNPGQIELPYKKPTKTYIETPFIYVPNSRLNTVVKLNTVTGKVLWTYKLASANAGSNPSRTTVDAYGNVWSGNRNGTYLVVLSPLGKLIQKITLAGNGSSGYGPRAITIDKDGNIWAGSLFGQNIVKIVYDNKLKRYKQALNFRHLNDRNIGGHICPYGATTDKFGNIWYLSRAWGSGCAQAVARVNAKTGRVDLTIRTPYAYGIGADKRGYVWVSGYRGQNAYQIDALRGRIVANYRIGGGGRGVAVDKDGYVWVACSTSNLVTRIDPYRRRVTYFRNVGWHTIGIAVDNFGKVWANSYRDGYAHILDSIARNGKPVGNKLGKFAVCDTTGLAPCLCGNGTPCTGCRCSSPSAAGPYTYSDMTGFQLQVAMEPAQGTWTRTYDVCCAAIFTNVTWEGDTPPGTEVLVRARTAGDQNDLKTAIWGPYVPKGQRLQVVPNRFIQIMFLLKTKDSRRTPTIRSAKLHYTYFNKCTVKLQNGKCSNTCKPCTTDYDCHPQYCGSRTRCVNGTCTDPGFKPQCHPPNIVLVLDSSCSMRYAGSNYYYLVDSGTPCIRDNQCTEPSVYTTYRKCLTSQRTGSKTCHYTRHDAAVRAYKQVVQGYGGTSRFKFEDRKVRFGLASFATSGKVEAPLFKDPPVIVKALDALRSNGSTNYTGAFQTVYNMISDAMKKDPIERRSNSVLFLTDGGPNGGRSGCNSAMREITRIYNMPLKNGDPRKIRTYVVGFGNGLNTAAKDCLTDLAKAGHTDRRLCGTGNCAKKAFYEANTKGDLADAFQEIINKATDEVCDGLDNDCDGIIDEGAIGCTCAKTFTQPDSTTAIPKTSPDYVKNVRLYSFIASYTTTGHCPANASKTGSTVPRMYEQICRNTAQKALGCAGSNPTPDADAYSEYCGRCCNTGKNYCFWAGDHFCKRTPWDPNKYSSPTACFGQCSSWCSKNKREALDCLMARGVLMRTGSGYDSKGVLTVVVDPFDLGVGLRNQPERWIFTHLPQFDYRRHTDVNVGPYMVYINPQRTDVPTYATGSVHSNHVFDPANRYITPSAFGITHCASTSACNTEKNETIYMIRGYDGVRKSVRTYRLGPIEHSSPVVMGAPQVNSDEVSYLNWRNRALRAYSGSKRLTVGTRPSVVYVGSNDGMMHAFLANADPKGKLVELWAYMPKTTLGRLRAVLNGQFTSGGRVYTVDATPVVKDVLTVKRYGTWRTVLIFGFGAGGRGYAAIDVTDPYQPKLMWEINHSSYKDPFNKGLGRYSNMGYTFGKPAIAMLLFNFNGVIQERAVAVLSGGIPLQRNKYPPFLTMDRLNTNIGNAVFIVDLETGRLVRELRPPNVRVPHGGFRSLAVSSTPVPFGQLPNLSSRVFVGDVQGRILRVDTQSTNPASWSMRVFFDLYDSPFVNSAVQAARVARKPIMHEMALAMNARGEVVVFGGTGDTMNFPSIYGVNKLFSLTENLGYDNAVDPSGFIQSGKVNAVVNYISDLKKSVTMDSLNQPKAQINAAKETGEKITGKPIIFDGTAYFTTYTPTLKVPVCGVAGFARIYGIHFHDNCKTSTCYNTLLQKRYINPAVTPIKCCEQGSTGGTCGTSNQQNPTIAQRITANAGGRPLCSDLDFTVPKFGEARAGNLYRFRMLGENTISMGPTFTFQPCAYTTRNVNGSDSSKGHVVNVARSGSYYLSVQVSGKRLASDKNFRLQHMRAVQIATNPNRDKGNFLTLKTNQQLSYMHVAAYGTLLE